MKEVSVPEAAEMLGVTPVRVRQLIAAGDIGARQIAGRWIVDVASLPSSARRTRPMSPRNAWATLELAAGRQPPWIGPDDERRITKQLNRLAHDAEPERLLRSWMAARADLHAMSSTDALGFRNDSRVVASGISDPRSGMAASPHEFEGYVHVDDFDQVRRDHLLVPAPKHRANVLLRAAPVRPAAPVPLLLLAADLADHDGPRENERARKLIGSALARRDGDRWSRV